MNMKIRRNHHNVRLSHVWPVSLGIFAAFALSLCCVSRTEAQQILGPGISLASLTNGQTVLVGDKLFKNFSIGGDFQASQVNVIPIQDSFGFGIRFSGAFVAAGQTENMLLGYSVTVTNSSNLIADAHLRFNGTATGSGVAQVVEQVSNTVFFGQMSVFASATSNQLENTLAITPPQAQLILTKDVSLSAQLPAFATISTIDQTFFQVPEPSAIVLLAVGLVGLCFSHRRFRSNR